MFKIVAFFACVSVAVAAPSLLAEHHTIVEEPVLTKVGTVVHSSPSAVSHQSFTRVHNKAVVAPVVAPVVKTSIHTVEPVVPVIKSVEHAPLIHTFHDASVVPVVKTVHTPAFSHAVSHQSHVQLHSNTAVVSPVVHGTPVLHAAAPIVHATPVVHNTHVVHAAPLTHFVHH